MRVAIGGIYHETNTFVAATTSLGDFEAYQFARGEDLLEYRSTRSEVGGALAGCDAAGLDVVPALFAAAVPSGSVEHTDFEHLTDLLIDGLTADGRPDGVILCLHGAMVTTSSGDADGELLRNVRAAVGPDVPIVVTLDLHSNTSDAMVDGVDAIVAYDTYPHVDMYERGREAAELLERVLVSGRRSRAEHRKLELLTPPQVQYTSAAPMQAIMERVHELEEREGVVVSVTQGFPYADVDCLGVSVVVSSDDARLAGEVAGALAEEITARDDDFAFESLAVAEAVDQALSSEAPVVLVDSADNVGGGSPGDGTAILEEWLRRGGSGLVVAITDPEAVAEAIAAGVASSVKLTVGAKTDRRHGDPVELSGIVRLVSDGRYTHRGSYNTGFVIQMGRSVVIESGNNTIVLTERRVMPFDAQQLLSLGVSPLYCQALVVKSAVAWRAAYGEYARSVIEVDAPGVCTANLHRLGLSPERTRMIRPRSVEPAISGAAHN